MAWNPRSVLHNALPGCPLLPVPPGNADRRLYMQGLCLLLLCAVSPRLWGQWHYPSILLLRRLGSSTTGTTVSWWTSWEAQAAGSRACLCSTHFYIEFMICKDFESPIVSFCHSCMCAHMYTCSFTHMLQYRVLWWSEDNLKESLLFQYHVGPSHQSELVSSDLATRGFIHWTFSPDLA